MAGGERGTGLRERKKRETRERIANAAMELFVERGFDRTTVAEVAAAADVSVKTVFNYFPAKEDLFFDRDEEVERLWLDAVRDRAPGEPPLAGLRRRVLARNGDRPTGPGVAFRRVMMGSLHLQARGQQMWTRHETAIAQGLAELWGLPEGDPTALVVAHQVLSLHPLALRLTEEWAAAGMPAQEIDARVRRLIDRGFDLIESGLAATG
ncbi:TetR/AcrR family transcriptional regulator [Streptomyces sp. PTM05]|uniref:TetR/AcrR family transcriptional regulator n=2 Tax=Streptantibioticus parmotrematis TaxID=2873249 RepID=A0ABS7QZS5_9ACTN|nr:TetR/AcrR family transcriptional regulator [Streptantibioticus parmotrematis]